MNKMIQSAVRFFNEVKAELRKVSWPKQAELIGSSIVVFILIAFFAVILGAMDFGFSTLIKQLFGRY